MLTVLLVGLLVLISVTGLTESLTPHTETLESLFSALGAIRTLNLPSTAVILIAAFSSWFSFLLYIFLAFGFSSLSLIFISITFSQLLLLSSSLLKCSAEGSRQLLVESFKLFEKAETAEMVMEGAMTGSRPPWCEEMCSSRGHCEATQMPLSPQKKEQTMAGKLRTTINSKADEYGSIYKPMDRKCKCGGMILNP